MTLFLGSQVFTNEIDTPEFLYKIISANDWADSQDEPTLLLTEDEQPYINFVRQDQIDHVLDKEWNDKAAVVLKIDTSALDGDLVYEPTQCGSEKYFNLYDGEVPLYAVVDVKHLR